MEFKSDIEIAQECEKKKITEIAKIAGIDEKYLEQYGNYKAKVDYSFLKENQDNADSCRRRKDHHICRTYRWPLQDREKSCCCSS